MRAEHERGAFPMTSLEHLTEWELDGFWWSPDSPDRRLAGRLSYKANEATLLRLYGTLRPAVSGVDPFTYYPIILGESLAGHLLTIHGSATRSHRLSAPGFEREERHCLSDCVGDDIVEEGCRSHNYAAVRRYSHDWPEAPRRPLGAHRRPYCVYPVDVSVKKTHPACLSCKGQGQPT